MYFQDMDEFKGDREKLGIEFTHLRNSQRITQDMTMEKTGLNRSTIIDIEKGRTDVRTGSLFKYMKAANIGLSV